MGLAVQPDRKYFDIAPASYNNDATGQISHINAGISQGDSVNQRDGKSYRVSSVWIRGRIFNGTTSTYTHSVNYLVWDKQPFKALPAITDIMDTVNPVAFPNRDNAGRFKILRRWTYMLEGETDTTTQSGRTAQEIDEYVHLPRDCVVETVASSTSGAIGNVVRGALYFISVGKDSAGTSAATSSVGFRINFIDL